MTTYTIYIKVQRARQKEMKWRKMESAKTGYHNVKCQVPETEELRERKRWGKEGKEKKNKRNWLLISVIYRKVKESDEP